MSSIAPARMADPQPGAGARSDGLWSPGAAARAGALAMAPFVVGYLPFALVIGATIAAHGSAWAGWSGSWLIYGGSAHLTAVRALASSGAVLAVVTALVANARLAVYSLALQADWRGQPRWFRLVAAGLIIDPTWAMAQRDDVRRLAPAAYRAFFLAAGLTLGVGWSSGMAVGVVAGGRLDAAALEVVVPLCLVSLVAPRLRDRQERPVVLAAGVVSLVALGLPLGTGGLVATSAGIAAALLTTRPARGGRP